MKVSYEWLKDYVEFEAPPQQVAERLTSVGLPCESLEQVGDDWVLDLEVPSNRPDCLGMIGVAREVAAALGEELKTPEAVIEKGRTATSSLARITVDDHELCPRYVARAISGVKVAPSPDWMQRRLESIGLRPINNVVDVTNYVLFETGQPLHAFDYDLLAAAHIIVRRARPAEKIDLLDGSEMELADGELVIADEAGPTALAGIMGGSRTEVHSGTTNLLLESASFLSTNIRRSSHRLGIGTESSYRFERSTDWNGVEYASRRAAALIAELAGGSVASGCIDTARETPQPRQVTVRYWRVEKILGIRLEKHAIRRILIGLGLESIYESGEGVTFLVPTFRPDLNREIDLIEEVARHHGYDRVPAETHMDVQMPRVDPADTAAGLVRERMVCLGFSEAVTVSVTSRERGRSIRPWRSARELLITNPPRADQDFLRQSLIPSLLEVRRVNQAARVRDVSVFELGRAYLCRPDGSTDEKRLLAALDDRVDGAAELSTGRVRAGLESVCRLFGAAGELRIDPSDLPYLEPGEGARIFLGKEFLGVTGRLAEKLRGQFDLRTRPAILEIDLDLLLARGVVHRQLRPVPRFPEIRRDVALVLDEDVPYARVAAAVAEVACPLREDVDFIDVYRGKQVGAGRKSMALSVTYRAPDRTLTDEEVNAVHAELVGHLTGGLGASLRE